MKLTGLVCLVIWATKAGSMHGAESHSHNPRGGEDTRPLNAAEWGLSVSRGGQIQEDLCQTGLINLRFLLF